MCRSYNSKGKSKAKDTALKTTTHRPPGHVRPAPPQRPDLKFVTNTAPLYPPEADDERLRKSNQMVWFNISSSSKMQAKVTSIRHVLEESVQADGKQTSVVALTCRAQAANKCIGIAEIAKREILKGSVVKCLHQYTGCWTRLETRKLRVPNAQPNQTAKAKQEPVAEAPTSDRIADEEDLDVSMDLGNEESDLVTGGRETTSTTEIGEEDAFETMQVAEPEQVRHVACLVLYLSAKPIARLRELYDVQVFETGKT